MEFEKDEKWMVELMTDCCCCVVREKVLELSIGLDDVFRFPLDFLAIAFGYQIRLEGFEEFNLAGLSFEMQSFG